MWQVLPFLAILLLPVSAAPFQGFQAVEDCKAASYGLPGFRSSRNLFPPKDILWDGVDKVAFQNVESTWLAGNFRDTGSAFVVVLFGGAIQHKEYWPEPNLMRTLAVNHGISSLAVDIAGRGESCGTEAVLNYTSAVRELTLSSPILNSAYFLSHSLDVQLQDMAAAVHFVNNLPGRYAGALFGNPAASNFHLVVCYF